MRLTNDRQQYCAALWGCTQSKTLTNWRAFFKLGVANRSGSGEGDFSRRLPPLFQTCRSQD
jgi:hypothetical protein